MDQNSNNNPPGSDPNTNPADGLSAPSVNPVASPSDLSAAVTPPSPADPIPSTTDPFPSPSAWASNPASNDDLAPAPGIPAQPDPVSFSPTAPSFDAGSQGSYSSGVPAWTTPAPVADPSPTQAPPPAFPAEEPLPTFTSPALGSEPSPPQFPPTWPPTSSPAESFDMGASISGENESREAGPTDLSHLMGGSADGETTPPQPVPVATTLMSPQSVGSETPANSQPADAGSGTGQVVTSAPSSGFPKWILLVGGVVLLVVVAASAYFILGIGKSGEGQQTSLPVEQAPLTNPPRVVVPSPAVQPPLPSTSSASFGNLQGSAPQPSTSSGQSGSSALELLRQRQGR